MCFFVCFAEGVVQYCTHSYIRRHKNIMVIKTFLQQLKKCISLALLKRKCITQRTFRFQFNQNSGAFCLHQVFFKYIFIAGKKLRIYVDWQNNIKPLSSVNFLILSIDCNVISLEQNISRPQFLINYDVTSDTQVYKYMLNINLHITNTQYKNSCVQNVSAFNLNGGLE